MIESPGPLPPTLETDRLVLRPHSEADLAVAAAMWADMDVVRHIGGRAFTRDEVWHRILRYVGHWLVRPYGYWAVTLRADGRFIGEIGFADWKRAGLERWHGTPEAGWVLCPDSHGCGYAAEALGCILSWADAAFCMTTFCMITPSNAASIRLANRAGYEAVDDRVSCGDGPDLYRRLPGAGELVRR